MRKFLYTLFDIKPAPYWWYNFLISTSPHLDTNVVLKQYGAMLEIIGEERWLVFESEAQYTWFVLRFSS